MTKSANYLFCGLVMLLCSVNKAVRSSEGGGGCVTLRDRPEGINHGCQPLTLSVWSLGHTWAWWSLPGNELQEAASIIHTYKSAVCPLFWEMRLNEGWPYLGSVLLIRRHVTLFCLCFQTPAASYWATCFHGTCVITPMGGDRCCSLGCWGRLL